jgi:hypothetical protein
MPLLTQQQIEDAINYAAKLLADLQDNTSTDFKIDEILKDKLYASQDELQRLLNKALSKGGVLTQQEYDALNQQIRLANLRLLELDAKSANKKLVIIAVSGVAIVGLIWYLIKRNK